MGIPSDVYDAQRLFVLTSNMDLVSLVSLHRENSKEALSLSKVTTKEQNQAHMPSPPPKSQGPPTILSARPFTLPPSLDKPFVLPLETQKLLQSMPKNHEIQMSSSVLRVLANVVDCYTAEIREIQLSHSALGMRASLQRKELEFQSSACRKIIKIIDDLKSLRRENLHNRLKRLQDEQQHMSTRIEGLRRSLVSRASPELNDAEAQWFQELHRINNRVAGTTPYEQASLVARVKTVRWQSHLAVTLTEEVALHRWKGN